MMMTTMSYEPHINTLPAGILHKIFGFLGPRDLCMASAVCRLWRDLNQDEMTDRHWKALYCHRWAPTEFQEARKTWQKQYSVKMRTTQVWRGRYQQDSLFGHKAGVRCIKLLPERNLVATGSLDKTMRLWDLEQGMPLSVSKSHGGTVRCVGLDNHLLVSGSADATVRVWKLQPNASESPDLSSPVKLQGIHTGPISGLALCSKYIYSGSWDCSVRMWSRSNLNCRKMWRYGDWVWAVMVQGSTLLASAGRDVFIQDLPTGRLVSRLCNLYEEGHVSSMDGSQNGKMIVTGAGDGQVLLHDVRAKAPVAELWHHQAGVSGVKFEDPWVASCSHDGTIAVVNIDRYIHPHGDFRAGTVYKRGTDRRQLSSPGGSAYCLDMVDQWIACGSESSVIRVWDFNKAEENARQAIAQRSARRAHRRNMHAVSCRVQSSIDSSATENEEQSTIGSSSEEKDGDAQEAGEGQSSTVPVPQDAEQDNKTSDDSDLTEGILHSGLQECCRQEARRIRWRNVPFMPPHGSESTDEGEVLEGLA